MNATYKRVATRFAPDTRFEVRTVPAAPFRALQENEFERLKNRLLSDRLAEALDPQIYSGLRRAANEAAALAWTTAFPLLFFPALFEEKAHLASKYGQRQDYINARTRQLLGL
jgi:hypothetical protein